MAVLTDRSYDKVCYFLICKLLRNVKSPHQSFHITEKIKGGISVSCLGLGSIDTALGEYR